jgi:hypothetical protein
MRTRDEHLNWCKERALQILESGDIPGAFASMASDLGKWNGGALYDDVDLSFLRMDAILFCKTAEQMRHWIEGFN